MAGCILCPDDSDRKQGHKKNGSRINLRYAFHDLNLKLNHRFSDRSRMFFSLYNGNDVLKGGGTDFSTEEEQVPYTDGTHSSLRWGNLMGTLGWTYVFNNRLFGRVSGSFHGIARMYGVQKNIIMVWKEKIIISLLHRKRVVLPLSWIWASVPLLITRLLRRM